jgi:PTH1 family peptidyl-tRNA hydrolase
VPQNTNLKEEPFPFKAEYLNLSGKAVQYWMDKENISLENIFVITDDLNLSFGTIRIRPKGSDGVQRIKNINLILNTNQYTFPFWN